MKKNNKWFTLIELMIVISISILLMVSIYAPYSYYWNKAKLKISKTQIAKAIYQARNMAIYWLNNWNKNNSIWVYFDNSDINKNYIKIYSYPYDYSWPKNNFSNSSIQLVRKIKLQSWVWITKINSQNNALFYFHAISWTGSYYFYNPVQNEFSDKKIIINFSFKNSWPNLSSKDVYYTLTNIVDY